MVIKLNNTKTYQRFRLYIKLFFLKYIFNNFK